MHKICEVIFLKFIAHRGDAKKKELENTLEAFKNAINNPKFSGFECDVRTSKDGVFVIHHDIFIDKRLINSITYNELKEKYHIPSLEEVLKLKTDKLILVEIKEPYLDIDSFLFLIEKYKEKNIYIVSFDNKVIQNLAKKDNHAKYGVLNYVLNSEKDYSEYDFIGLLSPVVTEELLDHFLKQNMEVFLYGITNLKNTIKNDQIYYIVDSIQLEK